HLDLSLVAVAGGSDAVDEDAVVAQEVHRLSGLPHHRQPQLAFRDERLHRAEAGSAVRANRHDEADAGFDQPLVSDGGQTGRLSSEVVPPHGFQPARLQSPPLSGLRRRHAETSSFIIERSCSRSSGPSEWPCVLTACSAEACNTSNSRPEIVSVQFVSLGKSRQSMTFLVMVPSLRSMSATQDSAWAVAAILARRVAGRISSGTYRP